MANKLIIAKGKGTIPNSGYQFDGDFREGTTPTLLDSRQAQRVKAFIENMVFRSMFEIQTGSPSQNSFQMDFSNNQSVWFRLAVQTALQFDKNPTLGGNLHLDNKYLISDQPGFKFVQYAASGFSVHPQSWPSDTLDAFSASSLLYGWYNGTPYHVGFRCPSSASLAGSGSLDARGGIVWVLPAADGSTGQVLSTNGSRYLSWITASGTGTVTSVATSNGTFVTVSGGTITTSGTITADLSATGTADATTFLRGDNTWVTPSGSGTVTSVATSNGTFINVTGGTITATGTITGDLSATGTASATTFLRGDNTWATPSSSAYSWTVADQHGNDQEVGDGGIVTIFGDDFIDCTLTTGSDPYWSLTLDATGTASATTFLRGDNTWSEAFDFDVKGDSGGPTTVGSANIIGVAGGYGPIITRLITVVNGTTTQQFLIDHEESADPAIGGSYTNANITIDDFGHVTVAANGSTSGYEFDLDGDSGPTQTVEDGNTVTLAGGNGLDTVASATDTVTFAIDNTIAQAVEITADGGTASGDGTVNIGNHSTANTVGLVAGDNVTLTGDDGGGTIKIESAAGSGMTSFDLDGDSGSTQTVTDGNTITLAGGTGLSSVASATDTITTSLDNTAVSAGSYTSTDLTVDAQGRITAASSGSGSGCADLPQSDHPYAAGIDELWYYEICGAEYVDVAFNHLTALADGDRIEIFIGTLGMLDPVPGSPFTGTELQNAIVRVQRSMEHTAFTINLISDAESEGAYGFYIDWVVASGNLTTTGDIMVGVGSGDNRGGVRVAVGTNGQALIADSAAESGVKWETLSFDLDGDSGPTQTVEDGNTITLAGGTAITTVASATDTVTLNLDDTAVSAGSYSAADITVDAQGRITAASDGSGTCGTLPESDHPYAADTDESWEYECCCSASIDVTFNSSTEVEEGSDYIHIHYWDGESWEHISGSPFTGTELASATKTVTGSKVKIRLIADGSVQEYGFKVTSIVSHQPGIISFDLAGDSGPTQTLDDGDTITLAGGNGLESVASADDTVTFAIDGTPIQTLVLSGNYTGDETIIINENILYLVGGPNVTLHGASGATVTFAIDLTEDVYWIAKTDLVDHSYPYTNNKETLWFKGGSGISTHSVSVDSGYITISVDDSVPQRARISASGGTQAGDSTVTFGNLGTGVNGNTISLIAGSNITITGNDAAGYASIKIEASPGNLTTKGDLEVYGTLQTRLGVGTDGQSLIADSSLDFGLTWGTPLLFELQADSSTGYDVVGGDIVKLLGGKGLVSISTYDTVTHRVTFAIDETIAQMFRVYASGGGHIGDETINFSNSQYDHSPTFLAGENIILISDDDYCSIKIVGVDQAPIDARYVVLTADGGLTDERVLTAGAGISITDAGAGSTVTVSATTLDAQYVVLTADADLTDERVLTAGTGISITDGGAGSTVTIAATGGGGGSGTVTSVATSNGTFVDVTGGTITTSGTITGDLSATGTASATTFLRGDNTWATPAGGGGSGATTLTSGTSYTSTATADHFYTLNIPALASIFTLTLPAASAAPGARLTFVIKASDYYEFRVQRAGSDLIYDTYAIINDYSTGETSFETYYDRISWSVRSDGDAWYSDNWNEGWWYAS